ncbi:MAG TPA: N-acyl homoserine lactonase family protein [Solirubrobacterales bacterium]|nr:N-acyl homoserine lactonase family protein [Solirubrobacterales bacterium]
MAVHVVPQPLSAPLPGGSAGARVTVEPLIAGHVDFPRAAMVDPGGSFKTLRLLRAMSSSKQAESVPVPAFLIHHPSIGPVLVDTGLHPSIASGGAENFGSLSNRFGHPSLKAGEDVPSQLRAKGIEPRQVPVVVMTHLHLDHTSAISEFPDSTFVVSAAEWEEAAHGSKPTLNGYRRAHFDLAFEYRSVDFDGEAVGSYATFGRTFDLFGDGSVRLAFTPGHSAGHCSVICRLGATDFVIGGDAMYMAGQLEGTEALPPRPFDAHMLRRSLQELRLFHAQFPDAVITPGHDPDFYARVAPRFE